jgi:hypothetical protein
VTAVGVCHERAVAQTAAVSASGASVWRDVDPRPPSASERRLLTTLATRFGDPAVNEQVDKVFIDGSCRCGCSSVRLRTDGPVVPAEPPSSGHDEHVALMGTGRTPDGHDVDVVLHLLQGRVNELEVFDTVGGEGVAVPLDDLIELC